MNSPSPRAGALAPVGRRTGWGQPKNKNGNHYKAAATRIRPFGQCPLPLILATEAGPPETESNISTPCGAQLKEEYLGPVSVAIASGSHHRSSERPND